MVKLSYPIEMEISGSTAMWTRPDSGDCPVSLLECEHLQNFPQLEHDFKVINSDTRLVIVDADIAERLCAGEVKWQELQKTSVQIGKYKLDKLKIPQIANEIYHWNLEYDNFLGYMAGIIKRKGTADKH